MDIKGSKVGRGFSKLSGIYDSIATIVFGQAILISQKAHLESIPSGSNILIVGGGTGKILTEILSNNPEAKIVYLEISQGMIEKAKRRIKSMKCSGNVQFILGGMDDLPKLTKYDVVITAYFLDMFSNDSVYDIMKKLNNSLINNGSWLFIDFRKTDLGWQKLLMKIMYYFFRISCSIEAKHLPETKSRFVQLGFVNSKSELFYHGMIEAINYQKT